MVCVVFSIKYKCSAVVRATGPFMRSKRYSSLVSPRTKLSNALSLLFENQWLIFVATGESLGIGGVLFYYTVNTVFCFVTF